MFKVHYLSMFYLCYSYVHMYTYPIGFQKQQSQKTLKALWREKLQIYCLLFFKRLDMAMIIQHRQVNYKFSYS